MNKKLVSFRFSDMALRQLDKIVAEEGADNRTEMLELMIGLWSELRQSRVKIEDLEQRVRDLESK